MVGDGSVCLSLSEKNTGDMSYSTDAAGSLRRLVRICLQLGDQFLHALPGSLQPAGVSSAWNCATSQRVNPRIPIGKTSGRSCVWLDVATPKRTRTLAVLVLDW